MRGIADAKQAWAAPVPQPVDPDGEQLDLVPVIELADAIAHERSKLGDVPV